MTPHFSTGPSRPPGIAVVFAEPVRKVTPHVFALRPLDSARPSCREPPQMVRWGGARLAGSRASQPMGESPASLAPELLNVAGPLLCF